jgi:hypothetical protein
LVGVVFITSAWNHLKDRATRSKRIGMSKAFTIFLSVAEVDGRLGVMFGVLPRWLRAGLS